MVVNKTRLIYTAGTFAITDELAVCRRLILAVSVLREPPTQLYQNERSNPAKGFLGYASFFVNDYCEKIIPLEFDPQAIILWDNPGIQNFYTTVCTGALVIDAIVALGAAMTPPALLLATTPTPPPFQGCPYTILKFKLLSGTRIQVDAIGEEAIACDGVVPQVTVPDFGAPPMKYPGDRAREDDPPRSSPEAGELPGDTAPVTASDPDASLSRPPCTMVISYTRSDMGSTVFTLSGSVPNATYTIAYKVVVGPGSIYEIRSDGTLGTVVVAGPFDPGPLVVTLVGSTTTCP